ncbi:glycosyltransferase family 2 protein [Oscillatoria sp. CS-180]|nr:glycosyltransferase family 2 protein [Oscillatoria sp. CS-180]MDB9526424.1 glycosyltransferase family 2 protein [Oscillatoria sp. CS-180]
MSCFNRRDTTLKSLSSVYAQDEDCDIYLVDDGSSDNTSESVRSLYPNVNLLRGDGSLFWGGGMRVAFGEALETGYQFYLWLNDDTFLENDAITKLLNTYFQLFQKGYPNSIIVGSVQDPATGQLSYGGRLHTKRFIFKRFRSIQPSDEPQQCDTMQGNVVLIPHCVAETVGNLDPTFTHKFGDLDYGLRSQKLGCKVWIAPGFLGKCSRNTVVNTWADSNLNITERFRKVLHQKEFPLKAWTVYASRHKGFFWWIHWFFPYIKAITGKRMEKHTNSN